MIVVSDAGPVQYLVLIDRIEFLRIFYEGVVLSPAVIAELSRPHTPEPVKRWVQDLPGWVVVHQPTVVRTGGLGLGERAAISLALEIGAELLVDDREAFHLAQSLMIVCTGTLGVLARAHAEGIDDIHESLSLLTATNFHSTPELLARTVDLAERQRRA